LGVHTFSTNELKGSDNKVADWNSVVKCMKSYGTVEVNLHVFLTLALGDEKICTSKI
jgi:hypothetical protein